VKHDRYDHEADVIVIGLGAAGGCAEIEAFDRGTSVIVLEKQPRERHYSNTRMSGGGFHSPRPGGELEALKAYFKAMFSGDGLPYRLEGEMPEFADELADIWAEASRSAFIDQPTTRRENRSSTTET